MGPDGEKGDVLSTWKEIAAFLNASVRSCIRWEKEAGLPVHRHEGVSRSRIFAYSGELDTWFKSRLKNGALHLEEREIRTALWRRPYVFIPIAAVVVVALVYLIFLRPGGKAAAGVYVSGVPHSSGSAEIESGGILETEFAAEGRLRFWKKKDDRAYFESWRIEPVRHTTCAAGDLDGDPFIEAAAPGHCREFKVAGDYTSSTIRFFINAYKYGYTDWWKTTYYDPSQCVIEKDNFEFTETAIGDVDGVPGNEIVLATAHALSVFRYEPRRGEIRLVCTRNTFIKDVNVLIRSAVIADIDGDGKNEILATANEGEEGAQAPDKGWLFLFRWVNGRPEIVETVVLPGSTSARALKVGDVIPGGTEEAVTACYRTEKGHRNAYIVGWAAGPGFVFDKFVAEGGEGPGGQVYPAVGDLSPKPGDEVLVGRNDPNELISLFWQGSELVMGPKYSVIADAGINNVQIGAPRNKGAYSCVLVSGSSDIGQQAGKFYMEILGFGDGFIPQWVRMGGEKEDLRVSFATFVEGNSPDGTITGPAPRTK